MGSSESAVPAGRRDLHRPRLDRRHLVRGRAPPRRSRFSHFHFDEADTALLFKHFEEYESEAKRLLDLGLILPGYDYIMKAAHAFNVLDARGAISVTERQKFILRVRTLARVAARAYVEKRRDLGFPMLRDEARRLEFLPADDSAEAGQ